MKRLLRGITPTTQVATQGRGLRAQGGLYLLGLALAGVLAASGCGVTGASSGQLSALSGSVNFGSVTMGSSSTQSVTVTNKGEVPVTISQVKVSGSGFSFAGPSLPITIPAGQNGAIMVKFTPSGAGSATGTLTIQSNAPGAPLTITLNATAVATPTAQIALNPPSINFGNVRVGTSTNQPVTISNPGTANLTVTQVTVQGAAFSVSGLSFPATLTPNQRASFTVTFRAGASGVANGLVTVVSNASGSPSGLGVTGNGVATTAGISLNPVNIPFGNMDLGSGAAQTVTIMNPGNATLTVTQANVSGSGFSIAGLTLPLSLTANQSSSFAVRFAPMAAGNVMGSVSLVSNAPNSPTSISLSGTGLSATPGLSVNPASIAFGSVNVGSNASQSVTLTNTGNAALSVTQANVGGSGFSATGLRLPLNLTAGQSASFSVQFAPAAVGSVAGSVSLMSNAPGSPKTITLAGSGVSSVPNISVSPSTVAFGNVTVGSSTTQTVTITNTGTAALTISQASVSGSGFSTSGLAVPLSIVAGQSQSFQMRFAPAGAGSVTGSLSLVSNAPGPPTSIPLSGTGAAVVAHLATLGWDASVSTISGYNVYRATVSGGPYTKLTSSLMGGLTWTDNSVTAGQTYFYVVTAVDTTGVESIFSNEVSVTIPTP